MHLSKSSFEKSYYNSQNSYNSSSMTNTVYDGSHLAKPASNGEDLAGCLLLNRRQKSKFCFTLILAGNDLIFKYLSIPPVTTGGRVMMRVDRHIHGNFRPR